MLRTQTPALKADHAGTRALKQSKGARFATTLAYLGG